MKNTNDKSGKYDEIDLITVIRHLWAGRWLIGKVTVAFVILGLIIAFTSTQQYKSEARLLPEARDQQLGTSQLLRQLGGLGGFSMPTGESMDAIRPELYPDVLQSTPFFMYLLEKDVQFETGSGVETVDVQTYLGEHMPPSIWGVVTKYTIKLPWTVAGWFRSDETDEELQQAQLNYVLSSISRKEYEAIKKLRGRINAEIDQRSGIISVSAEFSDPKVSAQIAQYSLDYLTEYITQYRIEKAKKDLEFIKQRYDEKKEEFFRAQIELARFRDKNQNIVSAAVKTEEQRLQDQYNLAFDVYNGLAQQLEQARITVQEETPVIKVLEPVQVPMVRSKPRRGLIIAVNFFLGGFLGLIFLFGKAVWNNIKERL